jgi:uncharacterized protein YukJ
MSKHHQPEQPSNRQRRRANRHGINYNVLTCRAIETQLGTAANPHYQVHVMTGDTHHRIAINVESQDGSEVLYYVDEDFKGEIINKLSSLPSGFTSIDPESHLGLDYVRGNLFDHTKMVPLPVSAKGSDNDLNDKIDKYMRKAIDESDAIIYAFGDQWGPEETVPDKIFGFSPGSGIHDIHMNQGNYEAKFLDDNGSYHDGGLILHFPSENRWVAMFLAFQSQSFDTDENGNPKDLHKHR